MMEKEMVDVTVWWKEHRDWDKGSILSSFTTSSLNDFGLDLLLFQL